VRDEANALERRVAVTANIIKELEAVAGQDEERTTLVSTAVAGCIIPLRRIPSEE
jgi:hypothetical protein